MDNKILDDIKQYIRKRLCTEYKYCAVAESDDFAILNSDDGEGKTIKITIKEEDE